MAAAALALALWPGRALMCSCIAPGSPQAAYHQADAVFVGHVVSHDVQTSGRNEYGLEIAQAWKGDVSQQQAVVTGGSSADCGYPLEVGETYLLYAHDAGEGALGIGLCSRNALAADAAGDIAYLNGLPTVDLEDETAQTTEEGPGKPAIVILIGAGISAAFCLWALSQQKAERDDDA